MNKNIKIIITIISSLIIALVIVYFESLLSNLSNKFLSKYTSLLFSLHIPILIYVLLTVFFKKAYQKSPYEYGFSLLFFWKNLFRGFLIAFFILFSSLLILSLVFDLKWNFSSTSIDSVLFTFSTSIIIGCSEEMYFRGFLNNVLLNNRVSFVSTAIISSVIFSVAHIMSFNPAETSYFWYLGIFFMGLLFSYLYKRFDSIFVPIGVHILWDTISFGLVGRNEFKGFSIENFNKFSKDLDNIEIVIIFIVLLLIMLKTQKREFKKIA